LPIGRAGIQNLWTCLHGLDVSPAIVVFQLATPFANGIAASRDGSTFSAERDSVRADQQLNAVTLGASKGRAIWVDITNDFYIYKWSNQRHRMSQM
jgi:hypothetical protein